MTDAVRAYVSVIRNPQNTHELQLGGGGYFEMREPASYQSPTRNGC